MQLDALRVYLNILKKVNDSKLGNPQYAYKEKIWKVLSRSRLEILLYNFDFTSHSHKQKTKHIGGVREYMTY